MGPNITRLRISPWTYGVVHEASHRFPERRLELSTHSIWFADSGKRASVLARAKVKEQVTHGESILT